MAETKKTVKPGMPTNPDEKAGKDAARATLQALVKTDPQKAAAVKAPSQVQVMPKAEIALKEPGKEGPVKSAKAEPVKAPSTDAKTTKSEADPGKEFVDGIMAELSLKGASKKRLIRALTEKYGMDRQRVMFKLKRALISERYAAAHAEGGH